jgi:4-hydroxy-2-oxoheptanedioate aldolase
VLGLTAEEESRYAGWGARYFAHVTTSLFTQALQRAARGEGAGPVSY